MTYSISIKTKMMNIQTNSPIQVNNIQLQNSQK